jgi:hypothetical protein
MFFFFLSRDRWVKTQSFEGVRAWEQSVQFHPFNMLHKHADARTMSTREAFSLSWLLGQSMPGKLLLLMPGKLLLLMPGKLLFLKHLL